MVGIFDLPRLGNSYDNGALVHLLEATGVPAYELNGVIDTLDAHDGGAPQTVTASDNIIYDDIDFIVSGSLRSNPSPGRRLDDVYCARGSRMHSPQLRSNGWDSTGRPL